MADSLLDAYYRARQGRPSLRGDTLTSAPRSPLANPALQQQTADTVARGTEQNIAGLSEAGKAFRVGTEQVRSSGYALRGLIRGLAGDEEGAEGDLVEAKRIQEAAAERGPTLRRVEDIRSLGDAGQYVVNTVAQQLPNLALTAGTSLATGGLGGLALRTGAGLAARQAAVRAGQAAGAAAAGTTLQSGQIAPEVVLDPEAYGTQRERATKAAIGSIATGALEAVPVMKLLDRFGLGGRARREVGGKLLTRMAKHASRQGATESLTELAQTAGERLTHRWVNENIEVLGSDALSEYLNAGVAGFVTGAVFGAPAGMRRSAAQREKTRAMFRDAIQRIRRSVDNATPQAARPRGGTPQAARPEGGAAVERFNRMRASLAPDQADDVFDTVAAEFDALPPNIAAEASKLIDQANDPSAVMPPGQLFRPKLADQLRRESGLDAWSALALSAVDLDTALALNTRDRQAVMAAAAFLATGDLGAVDTAGLSRFLDALPGDTERAKFVLGGLMMRERNAEAAADEASADVETEARVDPETGEVLTDADGQQGRSVVDETAVAPPRRSTLDAIPNSATRNALRGWRPDRPPPDRKSLVLQRTTDDGKVQTRLANMSSLTAAVLSNDDVSQELSVTPRQRVLDAFHIALGSLVEAGFQPDLTAVTAGFQLPNGVVLTATEAKAVRESPPAVQRTLPERAAAPPQIAQRREDRPLAAVPTGLRGDFGRGALPAVNPDTGKVIPNRTRGVNREYSLDSDLNPFDLQDDGNSAPDADEYKLVPRARSPKTDSVIGLRGGEAALPQQRVADAARQKYYAQLDRLARVHKLPAGLTRREQRVRLAPLLSEEANTALDTLRARAVAAQRRASETAGQTKPVFGEPIDKPLPEPPRNQRMIVERALRAAKAAKIDAAPTSARLGEYARLAARAVAYGSADMHTRNLYGALQLLADTDKRIEAKLQEGFADARAARGTKGTPSPPVPEPRKRAPEQTPKKVADRPDQNAREQESKKAAGRPDPNADVRKLRDELVAEIVRLRGKDVRVAFSTLARLKAGGTYRYDPNTGERLITIALNALGAKDIAHHEALHDFFTMLDDASPAHRQLKQELLDLVHTPEVEAQLRELLKDDAPFALQEALTIPEERLTYAYQFWQAGRLRLAPPANTLMNRIAAFLRKLFKLTTADQRALEYLEAFRAGKLADPTQAERVIADIQRGSGWNVVAGGNAPPTIPPSATHATPSSGGGYGAHYVQYLSSEDRGIIERLFRQPKIFARIRENLPPAARQHLDRYGYDFAPLLNFGLAQWLNGELTVTAEQRTPLRRLADLLKGSLGIPTDAEVAAQIVSDLRSGAAMQRSYSGLERSYDGRNALAKALHAAHRQYAPKFQRIYDKLLSDLDQRVRKINIPAIRKIAAEIAIRIGERGDEGLAATASRRAREYYTAYDQITDGLSSAQKLALVRALQSKIAPTDPRLRTAYEAMHKLFKRAYIDAKTDGVQMGETDHYFPVSMSAEAVAADEAGFRELMSDVLKNPTALKVARDALGMNAKAPLDEVLNSLVEVAKGADQQIDVSDFSYGTPGVMPAFRQQRNRVSRFVYQFGNDAQRAKFAEFQDANLDRITVRYFHNMTRKAEFAKRFGGTIEVDGKPVYSERAKLDALLAEAVAEGATKSDLELITSHIDAAMGIFNAGINPVVRSVFAGIDRVFGSDLANMPVEKYGAIQQAIIVFNNLRLLPLAGLASLVDPIGPLVRSGGLKDGLSSLRAAFGAVHNPTELREIAEDLGVIERHAITEALAYAFGGSFDPSAKSAKINAAVFKFNGLEYLTKLTRLTALALANKFLLRHAAQPDNPTSQRYLSELGLTAADVVPSKDRPGWVDIKNAKIRNALDRFVNESVVRPSPTQRPLWQNDPNWRLAAQYKGYLYAFYNIVVRRAAHEMANNNYSVVAPLLLYLPVTLAAELAREVAKFGPDGDPRRREWTLKDYGYLVLTRSGLPGPKFDAVENAIGDLQVGSAVWSSFLGPSYQKAVNLVDTALGDRPAKRTAIEALPASSVWKHWEFVSPAEPAP